MVRRGAEPGSPAPRPRIIHWSEKGMSMHSFLRHAVVLTLLAGTGATVVGGADTAHASTVQTTTAYARLAKLAQTAADTGSLGVIVRVDNGKDKPLRIARQTSWTKADHHLSAGDQFRVGSNTKTVVATLIGR